MKYIVPHTSLSFGFSLFSDRARFGRSCGTAVPISSKRTPTPTINRMSTIRWRSLKVCRRNKKHFKSAYPSCPGPLALTSQWRRPLGDAPYTHLNRILLIAAVCFCHHPSSVFCVMLDRRVHGPTGVDACTIWDAIYMLHYKNCFLKDAKINTNEICYMSNPRRYLKKNKHLN